MAYGRFDGFVSGLFYLVALVGLAFFDVKCEVVVRKVLACHTLDVFSGYGQHFIFVAQHFAQVLLIDKGVHQQHGLGVVRLHLQIEVAAQVGFDGVHLPVFKLAVGNLFYGFQCLALGTFVRLKATLVFVIQGDALHDIASLFAHGHRGSSGAGQFSVQ